MSEYIIQKADLEKDRREIIQLWVENGINKLNPSLHYDWAYMDNYAGQGHIWLLIHAPTQHAVGVSGLIPRRLKIGNSISLVGRAAGFAVDKRHRSLGPALMLQKAMMSEMAQNGFSMIYTLAPKNAVMVFKRLKCSSLGKLSCRRKLLLSKKAVNNHFSSFPGIARHIMTYTLDISFTLYDWLNCGKVNDARIERIHDFDSRFDALWERCKHLYPFTTERSSKFLQWRFRDHPNIKDFVCYALTSNNNVLGYTIFLVQDEEAYIVDFFTENQGTALADMSTLLWRQLRSDRITSARISAYGSDKYFNLLTKCGFTRYENSPISHELITLSNDQSVTKVKDETIWAALMADDFLDSLGFFAIGHRNEAAVDIG